MHPGYRFFCIRGCFHLAEALAVAAFTACSTTMSAASCAEQSPPTAAEIASAGDHLDEHGWCVIKNVVSTEIADDSCCMMDEFLGPHCKDIAAVPDQAEAAASGVR